MLRFRMDFLLLLMLLRGTVPNSEEPLHFGLVNRVIPPDELLPAAWQWAAEMAQFSTQAVRSAKEVMWRSRSINIFNALDLEERFSRALQTTGEASRAAVFTALAVSRTVQNRTGLSIRRVLRTLRPLRSATIEINGTIHIPARARPRRDRHHQRPDRPKPKALKQMT